MATQLSHTVHLPPLTDIGEFIGMHHNLFTTMGINSGTSPMPHVTSFNHPIPEENAKLVSDFAMTHELLKGIQLNTPLTLLELKVLSSSVLFVFSHE